MSSRRFVSQLLLTILIAILFNTILQIGVALDDSLDFIIISLVFFALICIMIFVLAQRAVKSRDKNFFIYIIVINLFVKIVASFILVVVYTKIKEPESKLFIIPFLINYLVFTVFETYFLSRQSELSS